MGTTPIFRYGKCRGCEGTFKREHPNDDVCHKCSEYTQSAIARDASRRHIERANSQR